MNDIDPATPPADAPVFVLSFNQRDELAAAAAGVGWRIVAARRAEGVESRFLTSGAAVAVIDARGALSDGLIAAKALGHVVETNGAAMLILVSQSDTVHMRQFYDAGATHFLSSPMSTAAISQSIRFALRHVERLAGGVGGTGEAAELLGWQQDGDRRSLLLTPALAALLGVEETPRLRALLRMIDPRDRALGRAALRRLDAATPSTAFAHGLKDGSRVVQHLQRDPVTGRLSGLVERLGELPDAGVVVREALSGTRDGPGARRWIDRRLAEGGSVAVLLIGLTRFETVNTAYGRAAGDAVLRAVSRRLSDVAREMLGRNVVVARLGGAEFLVASDDADGDRLDAAARRIEAALARPFVVDGAFLALGTRMAHAASGEGDTAARLLRRASETLVDGGASHVLAGQPLDELAAALRRAIDRSEIGVLFQPQVSIATGAIVGVEALARWRSRELGEVGAEQLFAAAEHAGLTSAVSDHLQRSALDEAARWPLNLSRTRLSINVSASDLARPGFADALLGRVDMSGFPPARLTIEITESGIMADLGEASRLLSRLRTAGCRVAIDDFGTGYSSLAYLKALPLDYLKIDKRLSQDIAGTARDRVVVRGVIDMARSLGLSVIAEGVETAEQLDLLAKEGCQYFQGYLCSGPIDSQALVRLVGGAANA